MLSDDVSGSAEVLRPAGRRCVGSVIGDTTLYLAHPFSSAWKVSVDGQSVDPQPAFGWSATYSLPLAGEVTIERATPWARRAVVAAQALAWLIAMVLASRTARRRLVLRPGGSTHVDVAESSAYATHGVGDGGVPAAMATAAMANASAEQWPSDGWAVEPGPVVDAGVLPCGAAL